MSQGTSTQKNYMPWASQFIFIVVYVVNIIIYIFINKWSKEIVLIIYVLNKNSEVHQLITLFLAELLGTFRGTLRFQGIPVEKRCFREM